MNNAFILQAATFFVLASFGAGCRSTQIYPSYPNREERPVVIVNEPHDLPPGQVKKIYGDRSARSHAPGQRKKYGPAFNYPHFPLIIIRTPDLVIQTNSNGKHFCQNSQGYYDWQGHDNRFYMADEYLDRIHYDEREYQDWLYKGKKQRDGKGRKDEQYFLKEYRKGKG